MSANGDAWRGKGISASSSVHDARRAGFSGLNYGSFSPASRERLLKSTKFWHAPAFRTSVLAILSSGILFVENMLTTFIVGFFPRYARDVMNFQTWQISAVFSIYPFAIMLISPIASTFCARIGRSSVVTLGLFFAGVTTLVFPYVTGTVVLCVLRAIQGAGAGASSKYTKSHGSRD